MDINVRRRHSSGQKSEQKMRHLQIGHQISPIKGTHAKPMDRKAKAQQVAEWIERTQGQQLAFDRVSKKGVSREYAFHDSKVMREAV